MNTDIQTLRCGACAGAGATLPMTIAMRSMHRSLPPEDRYPLPPEVITGELARRVNIASEPSAPGWEWKTTAAHVVYGASMGVLYAAIEPHLSGHPARKGALFGLGLWAGSYLGWLPLAKMPDAAKDEPPARNAMMIAAHLVFGAATGGLFSALGRR